MWINGVNIIAYVIVAIIGAIAGEITDVLNYFLPRHKKIFNKKNFKEYLNSATPKYYLMAIHILIYCVILFKYGANDINTVKYMVLTPMMISAFYIDYKKQIIPNRLTLSMFEIGLIFMFLHGFHNTNLAVSRLQGVSNVTLAISMFQGMFIGGISFLLITVVGGMIFGKETMGFGDVKMMGALGLYFGAKGIIAVAVLAFLIAAAYSIVVLIIQKVKHKDVIEYIAFGPFIVISAFITIFVTPDVLVVLPFLIFSLGKYRL